jgi:hypothetical protein
MGFEIARQDLKLRGPGEFVGSRQSGVPLLRYADLEMDADLVEMAREVAEEMLIELARAFRKALEALARLTRRVAEVVRFGECRSPAPPVLRWAKEIRNESAADGCFGCCRFGLGNECAGG